MNTIQVNDSRTKTNEFTRTPNRNRALASAKTSQNPAQAASGVRRDDRGGQRVEINSGKSALPRTGERFATQPSDDGRKEVVFELVASSAKEVLLAGDFTGWEKTPIKLRKGERGAWHATVILPPGQYHYKFVVDGQWRDDPRATASCPNTFGTCNSVLEIS